MGIPVDPVLETDILFRAVDVFRAFAIGNHATEIHVEPEDKAPRLEIHAAKRAADKTVEIPLIA